MHASTRAEFGILPVGGVPVASAAPFGKTRDLRADVGSRAIWSSPKNLQQWASMRRSMTRKTLSVRKAPRKGHSKKRHGSLREVSLLPGCRQHQS